MGERERSGVLLVNLGSPDSPETRDVRRYLKEFLSDSRVLTMPAPARWLLLRTVVLPFRSARSAALYRSIWTAEGSPLLVHGRALAEALDERLGDGFRVALAMRYGSPSIPEALDRLHAAGCTRIVVVPLFPQAAESSSGSAVARVRECATARSDLPPLDFVPAFFSEPGFIDAVGAAARETVETVRPDHVLFSYHGLPESHVRGSGPACLERPDCCAQLDSGNSGCYRAQCHATTRAVAARLSLADGTFSTAFQSRFGPTAWIGPQTDRVLSSLREDGVGRLVLICPAFVADCLETLEEIGIRAREEWEELGGEAFGLAPCVNATPRWVDALAELIQRR